LPGRPGRRYAGTSRAVAQRQRGPAIFVQLAIAAALVIANGVLAGAEIAIIALRRTQLATLAQSGSRAALAVEKLRNDPERFLATVQIGLTVASTTAAVLAGQALTGVIAESARQVPWLAAYAEAVGLLAVIAGLSFLTLVFGELVPKSLALRAAPGYALALGRPLNFLSRVLKPVVWVATKSSNVVLGLFGDETSFTESRLSPDELAHLVDEAARTGAVHPEAGEIAVRALDFGDVVVGTVMVPRTRVVALSADASPEEVRRVLLEENHSHLPVYRGTLDDVVGVVSTNDVLALAWERELIVLHDLLRPPHFVPESMRAADVLRELQRERLQFTIVVDERGGTAGIVTLKDLLEELVGELFGRSERPAEHVRTQPDGSFVVPGNMAVRDANRELPFGLPESEDFATVGGLATSLAGRLPATGDRLVTSDGVTVEVIDASPRRVRWVRVRARGRVLP
jgi:putative hemolysin